MKRVFEDYDVKEIKLRTGNTCTYNKQFLKYNILQYNKCGYNVWIFDSVF